MWHAAHQFERAAEGAAAERPRRALLYAVGYEDPPAPGDPLPPPPRFGHLLHESFFGMVPFFLWIAKTCCLAFALLLSSVGTYGALWGLMMRGQEVHHRPLFFDYSRGNSAMPLGVVDLRSTKVAPWMRACDDSHSYGELCINSEEETEMRYSSEVNKDAGDAAHSESVLISGKKYFFEVSLTFPETEINRQLGVFMVKVDLRSTDGTLLATSKQHSMLPYESDVVSLFRKIMLILPLSSRIISETRTINLLCFDNYLDPHNHKHVSLVEVSLGLTAENSSTFPRKQQTIQISSAELRYGGEMSAMQMLVRNWWWSCAFLGILNIFIAYVLITLRILNYKARRRRQNTQPYADLFDSIDESAEYSMSHPVSRERWTGVDIEILEDDEEDSSAWVPISHTRESVKSTDELETDNLVSDDESCSYKQNKQQKEVKGNNSNTNQSSRPGNLANDSAVTDQGPLLAKNKGTERSPDQVNKSNQKNDAREKEEKMLTDMVMKGLSKRDLFRGD